MCAQRHKHHQLITRKNLFGGSISGVNPGAEVKLSRKNFDQLKKMQYLSSINAVGSNPDSISFLQGVIMNSAEEIFNLENSAAASTISCADAKAIAANRSHSEAERRRRRRINGHLATLRTLLPNTIKTDKASLLAEVVRCLRELKEKTAELAAMPEGNGSSSQEGGSIDTSMLPSETDELKLCYCGEDQGTVQATLSCEDRPETTAELARAIKSAQAKVVRAEMATIGGRTKNVLWLQLPSSSGPAGEEGLLRLRRALKGVLDKSALLPGSGQVSPGNKRPRLYHC